MQLDRMTMATFVSLYPDDAATQAAVAEARAWRRRALRELDVWTKVEDANLGPVWSCGPGQATTMVDWDTLSGHRRETFAKAILGLLLLGVAAWSWGWAWLALPACAGGAFLLYGAGVSHGRWGGCAMDMLLRQREFPSSFGRLAGVAGGHLLLTRPGDGVVEVAAIPLADVVLVQAREPGEVVLLGEDDVLAHLDGVDDGPGLARAIEAAARQGGSGPRATPVPMSRVLH